MSGLFTIIPRYILKIQNRISLCFALLILFCIYLYQIIFLSNLISLIFVLILSVSLTFLYMLIVYHFINKEKSFFYFNEFISFYKSRMNKRYVIKQLKFIIVEEVIYRYFLCITLMVLGHNNISVFLVLIITLLFSLLHSFPSIFLFVEFFFFFFLIFYLFTIFYDFSILFFPHFIRNIFIHYTSKLQYGQNKQN